MRSWFFLVVSLDSEECQRINDLRQRPEKLWACALQIAKQPDYSPKQVAQWRVLGALVLVDTATHKTSGAVLVH
jgi:sulfate adenylyltransferase subunit 1 (EFTu-like GTPase family)